MNNSSLSYLAWKKFKRNKLAIFGLVLIIVSIFISISGYLLSPDNSPNCNEQFLELTTKKPGFTVLMLKIKKNQPAENENFIKFLLFGNKSEYISIPINSFRFNNDEITITQYSEYKDDPIISKSYKLADVVYSLSLDKPVVKKENGSICFCDINYEKHTEHIKNLVLY